MTPPPEPDPPAEVADEQLADLLEECLRAERAVPGSSAAIVQTAPEQLRSDLEQLLALGQALRVNSPRHASAGEPRSDGYQISSDGGCQWGCQGSYDATKRHRPPGREGVDRRHSTSRSRTRSAWQATSLDFKLTRDTA